MGGGQYGIKVSTFNVGAVWTQIYQKHLDSWLDGTLPASFESDYQKEKDGIYGFLDIFEVSVGPEVCSHALLDAVLSNAPRIRYRLAPLSDAFIFVGSLPMWIQDYFFTLAAPP